MAAAAAARAACVRHWREERRAHTRVPWGDVVVPIDALEVISSVWIVNYSSRNKLTKARAKD